MSTADLGQSILLFILICWSIIAIAAIFTGLVKQGKISGLHFMEKWRTHHPRHPHQET